MSRYPPARTSSISFGPGPVSTALKALIGANVAMFVMRIGAGALTVAFSLLPFEFAQQLQLSVVIGASGAVYGLLLAYAMYFPDRQVYMYFVFPIPARIFVAIMGAIAFFAALGDAGGVANATHLGGLLVGYLYLKSARMNPLLELRYQYSKWKT